MSQRRGFTLIELLVVISIIGLLSSVVLASLNSARDKGRISAGRQFSANVFHVAGDQAAGIWDFADCSGSVLADRSGSNNSGSIVNATWLSDTPSGSGCSLSFNGSNAYVSIPASPALDVSGGSFTVAAWAKTPVTSSGGIIVEHSPYPAPDMYQLEANANNIHFNFTAMYLNEGALFYYMNVADGRWHYYVGTLDSSAHIAKLYVDGALAASKTVIETVPSGTSATYIGSRGGASSFFTGLIDEVRVFSKTLTASEVGQLYASEAPRFKVAAK